MIRQQKPDRMYRMNKILNIFHFLYVNPAYTVNPVSFCIAAR